MRPPRALLKTLGRLCALALVLLVAAPAAALAQCPQTSLGDIEDEVTCPVCGVPLELATEAPQAQRQREFIIDRIDRCQSKDQIKAALVAEFGEGVLATPADDGFDLAAYLAPAAGLLVGLGAIAFAVVRWRRGRAPAPATSGETASHADSARLDRDMERYDL